MAGRLLRPPMGFGCWRVRWAAGGRLARPARLATNVIASLNLKSFLTTYYLPIPCKRVNGIQRSSFSKLYTVNRQYLIEGASFVPI